MSIQVMWCNKLAVVSLVIAFFAGCNNDTDDEDPEHHDAYIPLAVACPAKVYRPDQIEHLSGGDASVRFCDSDAFSRKSRNMRDANRKMGFDNGNHFFENPWVQGRQSTKERDGLGPYFNSNACQNCHIRDGRGHAGFAEIDGKDRSTDFASMLIRVSRSALSVEERALIASSKLASIPDTTVGTQLQHRAVDNVRHEADLAVSYTVKTITFTDGYTVELRKPQWHLKSHFGDFDPDSVFSARVAPPMIGLGLLQLIKTEDIFENERQQSINKQINSKPSGRVNKVWSLEFDKVMIGRFGWKAGQPSLKEQTAGAFLGDMGLTSAFHREENCNQGRQDCLNAPNGRMKSDGTEEPYEVTDSTFNLVQFYSHHLAVPIRRNAYTDEVKKGKQIFHEAGCAQCHRPSYVTGSSDEFSELAGQTIFPYTDMLLHDMGEDLADFDVNNNPVTGDTPVEFLATAVEWRTPPLWGLGLTHTVDTEATFLHDGRARTILEAVLWHGGEAESARQAVLKLDWQQRRSLLAFLHDL